MSKMSEIHQEITNAINDGELTFEQIARAYGVPISWVIQIAADQISVDTQFNPVV